MEQFEKKIRYAKLLAIYKDFLTHTQQDISNDYFLADLSISEISENRDISRSAVEDAIKKSTLKLDECEEKLHISSKNEKILVLTKKMKQKSLNCTEIQEIEEIEKELDYGI